MTTYAAAEPLGQSIDGPVVLTGRNLRKQFAGIKALEDVDVDLVQGQIVCIVGDNGAGKSTLVKILSGISRPDHGEIFLKGEPIQLKSPAHARSLGIEVVHQDLALAPHLSVIDNLFLGREILARGPIGRKAGILNRNEMKVRAEELLASLHVQIPSLAAEVDTLSGGQRQSIAVARAAFWSSTALLMDEPTAALGARESQEVLSLVRRVAARGCAVAIVSHAISHVNAIADRILVMRHGVIVGELRGEITTDQLLALLEGD